MATLHGNVLDRLLAPLADCLTVESAKRIADFQPDAATREHIEDLAQRANEGQLSEEERSEYTEYIEAMDFVGVLQHKARQVLLRRTGS